MDLIPHVFEAVLAFVGLRVVISQANQIVDKNSGAKEEPILLGSKELKLISSEREEPQTIDVSASPALPSGAQKPQIQKQLLQ